MRIRALAVVSLKPSALVPGVPTVSASGVPGIEMETVIGMWAPAKTPAVIVNQLSQASARFLSPAEVKERVFAMGSEASPSSPEQFAAAISSDVRRVGKLIKDAGLKAD